MSNVNTVPISVGKCLEVITPMVTNHWELPIMLHGAPGIGKTSIVEQLAKNMADDWNKKNPGKPSISGKNFHDIRLTTIEPIDLRGLPYFNHETKQSVFYPPEMLPQDSMPGIIFLDEITAAEQRLIASAYSLLQERRIGAYKVPDHWAIVAAGNGAQHGAISHEMGTAAADRFIHFDVVAQPDDWLQYMINHNGNPRVMTFIKKYGECLDRSKDRVSADTLIDASPRGWERFSKVMRSYDTTPGTRSRDAFEYVGTGIVGEAMATKFFTDLDSEDAAIDVRKLFAAKDDKELSLLMPKTLSGLYNMVFSVSPLVTDKKSAMRAFDIFYMMRHISVDDNAPVKEISTFGMENLFTKIATEGRYITDLCEHPNYKAYRDERKETGVETQIG